jgi:pimeloyl-ACP methyl ester carboxylesterase
MPKTALLLLLFCAMLAGCGTRDGASARTPPTIALAECRLPPHDEAVLCGTLEVPENRDAPDGKKLALKVAVFPAHTRNVKPDPLFLLAGGPGQQATEVFPRAMSMFERVRRERDIVLVDQRGSGGSHALRCGAFDRSQKALASADMTLPTRLLRECLAEIKTDTRHYATRQFVADLEAARGALGYARINIWGGSYGTRAALEYLRRYSGNVRSVVLDGVAPGSMRVLVDAAQTQDQALEKLIADCHADASCTKAYPTLREDIAAVLARADEHPRTLSLPDPATGETTQIALSRLYLQGAIGQFLYSPAASAVLPQLVAEAKRDDYAPLLANLLRPTNEFQSISPGLLLSVLCAEDASRLTEEDFRAASAWRKRPVAMDVREMCEIWPHDATPPDIAQPVKSDVPVLILSGGLDPVTPPKWGELAAKTLPNSRHLVAPGYGHLVTPQGCGPRLVAQFIREGSAAGLDGGCLAATRRPPFFINALGPAT